MLSDMPRAICLFLALALLLAPILHPVAMAAPGPAADCTQHHSGDGDENGHGGTAPALGSGFHVSCAGTGACDLHAISSGGAPINRVASVSRFERLGELAGREVAPDPSPPRAAF